MVSPATGVMSKKERARRLYKPYRFGYEKVAKRIGVHPDTVRRWLRPGFNEYLLAKNRARQARYEGVCADCGGPTRYNSRYPERVAPVCAPCAQKRTGAQTVVLWTEDEIVAAIRRWHEEHGQLPTLDGWKHRGAWWPGATVVCRRFGTWNAAIRAAGFTPRRPGKPVAAAAGKRKKEENS